MPSLRPQVDDKLANKPHNLGPKLKHGLDSRWAHNLKKMIRSVLPPTSMQSSSEKCGPSSSSLSARKWHDPNDRIGKMVVELDRRHTKFNQYFDDSQKKSKIISTNGRRYDHEGGELWDLYINMDRTMMSLRIEYGRYMKGKSKARKFLERNFPAVTTPLRHVLERRVMKEIRTAESKMEEAMETLSASIRFRSHYRHLCQYSTTLGQPAEIALWQSTRKDKVYSDAVDRVVSSYMSKFALQGCDDQNPEQQDISIVDGPRHELLQELYEVSRSAVRTLGGPPEATSYVPFDKQVMLRHKLAEMCNDTVLLVACVGGEGVALQRLVKHASRVVGSIRVALHVTFPTREEAEKVMEDVANGFQDWHNLMNLVSNSYVKQLKALFIGTGRRCDVKSCQALLDKLMNCDTSDSTEAQLNLCYNCKVFTFANISDVMSATFGLPVLRGNPVGLRRLGNGSTAEVFQLWNSAELRRIDNPFSGHLAVKKIIHARGLMAESEVCRQIVQELCVWRELDHRRIIPLVGLWFGFHDLPYPVPVCPQMKDGNLAKYLDENRLLGLKERLSIMLDIAQALSYMHNHRLQVSHGDLRPHNILVNDGHAYLCDFGLSNARAVSGSKSVGEGNWRWIAPEYFKDASRRRTILPSLQSIHPTAQADMYSFGCVCYQVLSGMEPFFQYSDSRLIVERFVMETHAPIRHHAIADENHWGFLLRCWVDDPSNRVTASEASDTVSGFMSRTTAVRGVRRFISTLPGNR